MVAGYELDETRASCWESNLGAPCFVADVGQLPPGELARWKDGDGRLVVIGGVPCQDFSHANSRRKMDTTLRDRVMHIVRQIGARPCIENVREAWLGIPDVQAVRDCEVGGLTIRERYFWGGPRVAPTHAVRAGRTLDGRQVAPFRGWGEAIEDAQWMADFTNQDVWESRQRLPVVHSSQPAWTVTSKTDCVVWRTDKRRGLRWLTPEDNARLQGFPSDWTFPQTQKHLRGSIGDAVPYAMGRAIARALREELSASQLALDVASQVVGEAPGQAFRLDGEANLHARGYGAAGNEMRPQVAEGTVGGG